MARMHFHESAATCPAGTKAGWRETEQAIATADGEDVHSVQMGMLSTRLFEKFDEIVIHRTDGKEPVAIVLGQCTGSSMREIRPEHNLYKLWLAGEFD